MNRRIRSAKGAISIYVALMMAGILSLGTFVLEAGRLQTARTQLSEATISASQSMLSSYNTELHTKYGLLAIDTSRATLESCRDYLDYNSDLASDMWGNNISRMYTIEDATMSGVYNLTYPHILKRQLLTVAKYNLVPENSEVNLYTVSYILDELQMKCRYVSEKMGEIVAAPGTGNPASVDAGMRAALAAMDKTFNNIQTYNNKHNVTLTGSTVALLPSTTGTVESVIPERDEETVELLIQDAHTIIGSDADALSSSSTQVSESSVTITMTAMNEVAAYHRGSWVGDLTQAEVVEILYARSLPQQYKNLADTINASINILKDNRDGNLLLNSYVSQMFSNRTMAKDQYVGPGVESTVQNQENMTFAKACCEYIFGGSASELNNQSEAYEYVMAMRMIGNLYAVLTESTALNVNDTYSVAAHLAWAYYETCMDMELVINQAAAVPLTKDALILPLGNTGAVTTAFASRNASTAVQKLVNYNQAAARYEIAGRDALNYTDSLSLALWFVPNDQKLLRVADLIQLEMRYSQQYQDKIPVTFLMSNQNTYCRVECTAKMNAILPILSIGGADHSLQGHTMSSTKYAGY